MPKEYPRSQRVADQIQRELAMLIQREIQDPRVHMVSITGVEVTRDLAYAHVYVTTLDDAHRHDVVEALNHAAGFLRHELGSRMRMRHVPELKFSYDESIERGMQMDKLLAGLKRSADTDPEGE
ncbi:MAG: 30S ribosome-binding factor RbfA [Granulosicoccaceae bacterium]|jgi:ribosome-binding factor A